MKDQTTTSKSPVETFLAECEELLGIIEETLLALHDAPGDPDLVGQLFRAFHNVKGSAGMFGFDDVGRFTHRVETVLDHVRAGRLSVSEPLVASILKCKDHLVALLHASFQGVVLPDGSAQLAELEGFAPASAGSSMASRAHTFRLDLRVGEGKAVAPEGLAGLFKDLGGLGSLRSLAPASGTSPEDLAALVARDGVSLELTTAADENAIRDVLIFLQDELDVSLTCLSPVAPTIARYGIFDEAPASAPASGGTGDADREAPAKPQARGGAPAHPSVVKVSSEKLDRLVGLVGELVINYSRVQQAASRTRDPELTAPLEEMDRLVAELRDGVLGVRMTAIGTIFVRLKRLVHDLGAQLDKEVELVTEGADTELDKTVLDKLTDPLMHLIRNAVDHGLETPDERRAAGKSPGGQVKLSASQAGQNVVIAIADDGRGLDVERIRQRALERGLIAPDARLSRAELHNLIMAPGLSTARELSDISGRGVGMDVVKRQIELLRGTVSIASTPGAGTTFKLTLPLTLAIIEGLLVEVGPERFILPLSSVVETIELPPGDRARHNGRCTVVIRDEMVPYVGLRETFGLERATSITEKVVVVERDEARVGVVVDRVVGIHQTVIQPLGRLYRDVHVVSGATIMGDGRSALILDISAVVAHAEKQRSRQRAFLDLTTTEDTVVH